jgi:hypothetical protein
MRKVLAFCLFVGLVSAAPTIRDIQPHGAQRGKTFTLTLKGDGLAPGAKIQTTLPAGISRMLPSAEVIRPGSELPFLVELKKDAPVGLYPLRLLTDDGISNVVLFAVGDLPEVEENETKNPKQYNNAADQAETIAPPVVMNGTLTGVDEDHFVFTAKAGQKLVFEVEARRNGSAIDPAIDILDSTGRVVAKNDDAPALGVDSRVEIAFAKTGEYRVRVHDSKYSDQTQNFYRLKVGSYPYAETVFPLGWRKGEDVEVELSGGNLPAPIKVKPAAEHGVAQLHLPGSSSLPLLFTLGNAPEALEPATGERSLAEGVTINGRIAKPGEIDKYKLRVRPGEDWMIELQASSLGTSQLDALVTVYDAAGKKLASRDDLGGADPALPVKVPEGVGEVTVAVEDLLARGGAGFGYRLAARKHAPDFTLDLATPFVNVPAGGTSQVVVVVQRRGYDGEMRIVIPDLPKGFTAAGGHVASEAAQQDFRTENMGFRTARSVVTITAEPDVATQVSELTVMAIADTPQGRITRVARAPGMVVAVRGARQGAFTAPWLGMKLALGVEKPLPVTLTPPVQLARISQGFEWPLNWRIERRSGFRGSLNVRNQIASGVGNLRILKSTGAAKPDSGGVLVNTNFATPVSTFDMILEGQTEIDGKQVTITAPAVSIQVVPGFEVRLDAPMNVTPGGRVEVRGHARREPTFEGSLIKIQAEDLPEHVRCAGVDVPEGQTEFVLACEAGPAAAPGTYPIRIASRAPETGRRAKDEYKIADLETRLVVGGPVQASR